MKKPIIAKKYPMHLKIEAPEISQKRKIKHLIFITALLNGDIEGLQLLFENNANEMLEVLESRYKVDAKYKELHLENFPNTYLMDDVIKANAIGLAIQYSAIRNWGEQKKWGVIEILVKKGANPIALFANVDTGFLTLKNAVAWGADINTSYKGYNALHAVVTSKENTSEKIRFLIEKGIDVNSISNSKELPVGTPLHLLLANEDIAHSFEIIELAKDKLNINLKDGEQKTPLLLAAKIRNKEVVKLLLTTFKGKIDVNAVDANNRSALHFACAYGDAEMAELLINAGANINAKDNRDNTPLHYANAKPEAIRAMLESIEIHADRDSKVCDNAITDSRRFAIAINDEEILLTKNNFEKNLNVLLKKVNSNNNPYRNEDLQFLKKQLDSLSGKSLLDVCLEGQLSVIKLLIENKVNALATNVRGNKASDIAQDKVAKEMLLAYEEKITQQHLETNSNKMTV